MGASAVGLGDALPFQNPYEHREQLLILLVMLYSIRHRAEEELPLNPGPEAQNCIVAKGISCSLGSLLDFHILHFFLYGILKPLLLLRPQ